MRIRANKNYFTKTQQNLTIMENNSDFSPGGQFILALAGWRVFRKMNNPNVDPVEVPRFALWSMVGNRMTDEARQIMERKHPDYIYRKYNIKEGRIER